MGAVASRPSELAITIATMPKRDHPATNDGWVFADSVAHRLRRLGFEVGAQQVANWLRRMEREDLSWIESRSTPYGAKQYRVTQWGSNDVQHKLGLELETPWTRRT